MYTTRDNCFFYVLANRYIFSDFSQMIAICRLYFNLLEIIVVIKLSLSHKNNTKYRMCTHVMEVEVKLPRGTRRTQGRVEGHGNNMPNVNSYLY